MAEILSVSKIVKVCQNAKKTGKAVVLAGGCFDILHPGHTVFLEKAKQVGDMLIVFLESDQKVKQLKGSDRPVHTQKERAQALSALGTVDFVVMLPFIKSNAGYDKLISQIKPDVIAITSKDAGNVHHQRTAELVGAKLQLVTKSIGNYSSSKLLGR